MKKYILISLGLVVFSVLFFTNSVSAVLETETTFKLTYIAGEHGSLIIAGSVPTETSYQTINQGAFGAKVEAVPDEGYNFVDWSDGSNDNPRTDMDVQAELTVTANFASNQNDNNSGGSSGGGRSSGSRVVFRQPEEISKPTPPQVLGVDKFIFSLLLKTGSRGNEVMELQKFLNTALHDSGIADGIFGPKTKSAVIKFQLANNLDGDGIVGPLTRKALNK